MAIISGFAPQELKYHLDNNQEIRYSLRTGSLAEAKEKTSLIAGHTQRLFRQLRQRRSALEKEDSYMATNLSDSQISNYYPAGGLPHDSVLEVQTRELLDLQNRLSDD
jgi:hypothetical protein